MSNIYLWMTEVRTISKIQTNIFINLLLVNKTLITDLLSILDILKKTRSQNDLLVF